jgi:L-rhamnonate dehydratase
MEIKEINVFGEINRKIITTAIATGEHEYTKFGFQQLLDANAAAILQPDICWCGGLTEAKKICAMAAARNLPVIPHGGGLQPWAQHLTFSQVNIPMVEYMYMNGADQPNFDPVFEGIQHPENGWFTLPQEIGAGIRLRDNAMDVLAEYTGT